MAVTIVDRSDQYVLNHCARFLARDTGTISEPFHFPIVDTHWDGHSADTSYAFNDVTFVHDARNANPTEVGVIGTFADLYRPVALRRVAFLGEPTGLWAVTVRVPKAQVHPYKYIVDGVLSRDPINPQRQRLDNGQEWSRFFTHGCAVPIVFEDWEVRLLERLVDHLLPFQLEENRRFVAATYNRLNRLDRDAQFPLAYRMDESVGVVNYLDKLLAKEEAHNLDDYKTCLQLIADILRQRFPGRDPWALGRQVFVDLYEELGTDTVAGWDTGRYGSPAYFLLLLRRHAMTGAFAHPKHGGNPAQSAGRTSSSAFRLNGGSPSRLSSVAIPTTGGDGGVDEFDAVIIGSGAGGAPVAHKLVHAGKRVLVLEKGPGATADGAFTDPLPGQPPMALAFEMIIRGWDAFLGVGTSPNPHGGVGRNLLSNYFGYAGSGELGRRLESWNLDAFGNKAVAGAVEPFLAVDYMDLHIMEPGCGIGLHRHRDNSEAFLMLDGEGWMVIGNWADNERRARCFEVRTLRAGHLALLRGGNLHGLANPGAGRAALFMFGGYD